MPISSDRLAACAIVAFGFIAALRTEVGAARGQVTVDCSILEEQCREGAAIFEKRPASRCEWSEGAPARSIRRSRQRPPTRTATSGGAVRGTASSGGRGRPAPRIQVAETRGIAALGTAHAEHSKFGTDGIYLGVLGFGYNSDVLKEKGLPEPKCRADLLDPKLKDEVQVADPCSSGTAYLFLATPCSDGRGQGLRVSRGATQEHQPVHQIRHRPVKAMALGETTVGIAFIHDMMTQNLAGGTDQAGDSLRRHGLRDRFGLADQGGRPETAKRFAISPCHTMPRTSIFD